MDPASAIIGIVAFSITVCEKINTLRKELKGAPRQVQTLQELCGVVELFLDRLQSVNVHEISYSAGEASYLNVLCDRSQRCLEAVDKVAETIVARIPNRDSAVGLPAIRWRKWISKRADLEELSERLSEVRDALGIMLDFMHSRYLESIATQMRDVSGAVMVLRRNSSATSISRVPYSDYMLTNSPHTSPPIVQHSLKCLPDCQCRCHSSLMASLVPIWLASYIGHVFVSKQLLYPPWSTWSLCTVQTCRGDAQRMTAITWLLPHTRLLSGLTVTLNMTKRRVHFSLATANIIPYSSPVFKAIYDTDLHTLRDLFCRRTASIWDADIDGRTMFWNRQHACKLWQEDHAEDKLDIVRFYMDAGADSLLFAEASRAFSAHDSLALGLLQHLSDAQAGYQSLATRLRTNPVAIDALRSIFNIDPMYALEDYASRKRSLITDIPGLLASFADTNCDPGNCLSVLKAFGYSPLEYAIRFAPYSVSSVLADGADATEDAFLACAIERGRSFLVKPLLDAGADVNIKGRRGYTALHQACFWCFYPCFNELLLWAGDQIDWNARTPEGQSALDLFELGVSEGRTWGVDPLDVDEWRSVLESRIRVMGSDDEGEEPKIPGAFPSIT